MIKLPLDDDEEDMICRRRFMKKNYYISKSWSKFSSEYALDLSPSGNTESMGINKNEYDVAQYGTLINFLAWLFK